MGDPRHLPSAPQRHVFVVGLDDANARSLEPAASASGCRIHALFHHDEVRGLPEYRFEDLLAEATDHLEAFGEPIAGICSFWDFPVCEVVAALNEHFGLPGATLASIVRVQHKYWSRLIQRQAAPEATPPFALVDPAEVTCAADIGLAYPFWLKPVRSFRSHLAFRVANDRQLDAALRAIRDGLGRLAKPYGEILRRVELPPEVEGVDGSYCVAEAAVTGRQCTVEGYVYDGEVHVYGVVDSVRFPGRSSFLRYQYPSRLPRRVREQVTRLASDVIRASGYGCAPFNVELFWNPRTDRAWILEINARHSQSHAELFEMVDGVANHRVMLDLALGRRPAMPHRQGRHRVAARWFLRHFRDGVVVRAPDPGEVAELHRRFPGVDVHVGVRPGQRLADLVDQDAYTYELCSVDIGAKSYRDLLEQYRRLRDVLPLEVSDR